MPIHYQCDCGATIRLPDWSVGRRARCQTCQKTFTVPDGPSWPENLDVNAPSLVKIYQDSTPPPPTAAEPRLPGGRDQSQDAIQETKHPFWKDLLASFALGFDAGNVVTLLIIVFLHFWLVLLSFAGRLGFFGQILIYGYLCAFYQSIIVDTAAGEDKLPNTMVSNVLDDLILPLVQFIATWFVALIPAVVAQILSIFFDVTVPPWSSTALIILGCAFWPIIILAVSIGGGFSGLWPHVIVLTALAAPLAYGAICATLVFAVGLTLLPELLPASWLPSSFWTLHTINGILSAYAAIVAMRAIGLYYRHFKHKFPWTAE